MRRSGRRFLVGGAFAVAAAASALTLPGLASAAEQLGDTVPVVSNQPATYDFRTTVPAWSVVSLRSSAGSDFNLRVYDGPGSVDSARNKTDFVLVNSNPGAHAPADYIARTIQRSGPGRYSLRFNTNVATLGVPTNPAPGAGSVIRTTSNSPVTLVRLNLTPGLGFRLRFPPRTSAYVLNGNPGTTTVIGRDVAEARNISAGGQLWGAWTIGSAESGGCIAFTDPNFGSGFVPVLVLIDDEPMGSAGKTFQPYAYNREVDPEEC
ncbi:hypothetical protein [Actinoplanes sp. NPDC049118]|uniref:hypothetical protein n=1 Tax=Actinoplanes sp. NPDC049118 TaxID=3155769 RepID=UPI0033E451ED